MKVKAIHIQNFRCFERADMTFESVTTIVGENGAGKSAILEAVNLAVSPNVALSRISEQDFHNADSGDIAIEVCFDECFVAKIPDGYTTQSVTCSGVRLEVKRREKAAPGKALCDGYVVSHCAVPDESIAKTAGGWSIKRQSGSEFHLSKRHLQLPLDVSNYPRCFYMDKERDRHLKTGFSTTLERLSEEFNWRFRKSLDATKVEYLSKWESLYEHVMSGIDDKKLAGTLDAVKKSMSAFLGDHVGELELSFLQLEQPFAKSFFAVRDGCNQIEQSGLGSGISMILAYFLQETISGLAKEPLIFLVDEPELHLHPQLQRRLRQHCQASDAQVILATHSELMVDIGDWRSIKRVDRRRSCHPLDATLDVKSMGGTGKAYRELLDEIAATHKQHRLYLRENNELLFADICALVEGPIDRYGLQKFAANESLDCSRLTMICCHGKEKIAAYALLCRAYAIPFFIFFDCDGMPETNKSNADIIALADANASYGFVQSFESVFGVLTGRKAVAVMSAVDASTTTPREVRDGLDKLQLFIASH